MVGLGNGIADESRPFAAFTGATMRCCHDTGAMTELLILHGVRMKSQDTSGNVSRFAGGGCEPVQHHDSGKTAVC